MGHWRLDTEIDDDRPVIATGPVARDGARVSMLQEAQMAKEER
jgi:hypothetical protein